MPKDRPTRSRWRWVLRAFVLLVALAVALLVWANVSPWPSTYVIRTVFDAGGRTIARKLAPHVPKQGLAEARDVQYDATDRDAKLDIFHPQGVVPRTTVVWIHGGGHVAGKKEEIANYLRILASKGYGVVGIEYTRAPDAHYPVPVEQANRALGWLSANAPRYGLSRDRFVLAGDSAGAQIAAQVANIVTSPKYARDMSIRPSIDPARLVGAVLFCGPFDAQLTIPQDGGEPSWFIRSVMWAYMGRKDYRSDPRVAGYSVARFVTKDFPPAFISVGNDDPLQAHSYLMADQLRTQGVPVDVLFWPRDHQPALPHEYQFDLDSAEGAEALRRTEAFLAGLR